MGNNGAKGRNNGTDQGDDDDQASSCSAALAIVLCHQSSFIIFGEKWHLVLWDQVEHCSESPSDC